MSSGRNSAIVVAPQGARSDNEDHDYLDLKPTENWPRAISHDLTRCIDARFRTIANRSGRALIAFYVGRQDDRFADDNENFSSALAYDR